MYKLAVNVFKDNANYMGSLVFDVPSTVMASLLVKSIIDVSETDSDLVMKVFDKYVAEKGKFSADMVCNIYIKNSEIFYLPLFYDIALPFEGDKWEFIMLNSNMLSFISFRSLAESLVKGIKTIYVDTGNSEGTYYHVFE